MSSDLFNLEGEVAVIVGGTGAIGKAFASALLTAGAAVCIWGRGKSAPLEETVEEVEKLTGVRGRLFVHQVDATDKAAVREGLERAAADAGTPTVLINAVGGTGGKAPFIETDTARFEEVLRLNLVGGLLIPSQVFAGYWIGKNLPGSIINVASMTSYVPLSGVWAYDAAKAGVMNLTMGAAREFAPYGIRVNAVAPGFFVGHQNKALLYEDYEKGVLTERGKSILGRTPYGRFGNAEDLYGTVVFLASRKASGFITGVTVPVDGGYLIDNI